MKKIIVTIIICGLFNNAHTQSIDSINYLLDNVIYAQYVNLDYKKSIELPDSTKNKVIAVLNGYLPPGTIEKSTFKNEKVLKNIEKIAKEICDKDTVCFMHAKDSVLQESIRSQLYILRNDLFPKNFILAIGSWNIKEAEPILLQNINNPRFPKLETLLALAKLGNNSANRLIEDKFTVKDTISTNIIPIEFISNKIIDFYTAGMYLKNKKILLNMIDLLDIGGKGYFLDDELVPIEEITIMFFGWRFFEKQYIDNESLDEWLAIIDKYFYLIENNRSSKKIGIILTGKNKKKIKGELKRWINENVTFQ